MLIERENGIFDAGQADIICILRLPSGTFHAAFFEEHPFPGETKPITETDLLRLKSKMHYTDGNKTLEGAQVHVDELREKILLPDNNIIRDRAIEVSEPVNVWLASNWIKAGTNVSEALAKAKGG